MKTQTTHLLALTLLAVTVASAPLASAAPAQSTPPNILLFVVDDMDFTTFNAAGCPVPGLVPNMERLAREGMLFDQAHVPNAVCGPSRQSMMTGLHPHRNGTLGFVPVPADVPNLSELLMARGYYTASFNKGRDYQSFKWTEFLDGYGTRGFGRDPGMFVASAKKAIAKARSEGKPFLLNVAVSDPHRAFPGSLQESETLEEAKKRWPAADAKGLVFNAPFINFCSPEQAWVPPFLPKLPDIQKEWAQYYNGVHRADDTLGRIMELLKTEGVESDTIVIFFSDNGASFPTDKQNCYPYSTRTPLIVRWPGVVQPGGVDREHLISTMDLMPTLLEAVSGIPAPLKLDGRSLIPLLKRQPQSDRDHIFTTQNYITPGTQVYPMRAVHTRDYSYIFNAWSNGKTKFNGECHSGLTFEALQAAAKTDKVIEERLKQIEYRVREELYDLKQDPGCLHNLANDAKHATVKAELKQIMSEEMVRTEDPLLPSFQGTGPIPASWLKAIKRAPAE